MATPEQTAAFQAEVQRMERISSGQEQPREQDLRSGVRGHFEPVSRPDVREPTPAEQQQRIADLDADLQRRGLQLPNNAATSEPDPQLVNALQVWLRENGASVENLKKFEAGIEQAYRGRRYGETPSQFEARMASGTAAPAADAEVTAAHAKAGLDVESDDYRAASPEERRKAAELAGAVIPSESVPEGLRFGYTLPAGLDFSIAEHVPMLAQAKAAGLPQSVIDRYIEAGL